jgi:ADP-ribose pyrophosphatase
VLVFAEMPDGTVPMLRQYKHGAGRVCLTFPGGAIDEGESPIDAARRELREELGVDAGDWHDLGAFVTNANQGCNTAYLFRARGCRVVSAPHAPDIEAPTVEYYHPSALATPAVFGEIGLAAHVALLLLATHPAMKGSL